MNLTPDSVSANPLGRYLEHISMYLLVIVCSFRATLDSIMPTNMAAASSGRPFRLHLGGTGRPGRRPAGKALSGSASPPSA